MGRAPTNIKFGPIKQFAIEKVPKDSALRDVLLAEAEELTVEEFLVKMPTWLILVPLMRASCHGVRKTRPSTCLRFLTQRGMIARRKISQLLVVLKI